MLKYMDKEPTMKKATDLFDSASLAEQNVNVPTASMVHEVFDLAEEAAGKGQFSVLIDLEPSLKDTGIVEILKSWGYSSLVIKDGLKQRLFVSWIVVKHKKISLI